MQAAAYFSGSVPCLRERSMENHCRDIPSHVVRWALEVVSSPIMNFADARVKTELAWMTQNKKSEWGICRGARLSFLSAQNKTGAHSVRRSMAAQSMPPGGYSGRRGNKKTDTLEYPSRGRWCSRRLRACRRVYPPSVRRRNRSTDQNGSHTRERPARRGLRGLSFHPFGKRSTLSVLGSARLPKCLPLAL